MVNICWDIEDHFGYFSVEISDLACVKFAHGFTCLYAAVVLTQILCKTSACFVEQFVCKHAVLLILLN